MSDADTVRADAEHARAHGFSETAAALTRAADAIERVALLEGLLREASPALRCGSMTLNDETGKWEYDNAPLVKRIDAALGGGK